MTPGTKLDSRLRIFCIFFSLWFLLFALSQPLDAEFQPQQRLNDATLDHLLLCGSGPSCVTCCRCYCCCCCRVLGSPNDGGSSVRDSATGKYWFRVVAGFVLIHISLMRKTIGNEIAVSVYTLRRKTSRMIIQFMCSTKVCYAFNEQSAQSERCHLDLLFTNCFCFPRHYPMCVPDVSRITRLFFIYFILFIIIYLIF